MKATITTSPKVSIVIPIFGVEKYIEKCIRSLFEQTLDGIELIFVDDGTKDKSLDILNSLVSEFHIDESRIKILHHKNNQGLPVARHTGLLEAKGEYILHCDSDDWLEPDMCESLYNEAVRSGADIVFCDHFMNEQDNEIIANDILSDLHYGVHVWNHLVRRSLYENDIIFPIESMAEDQALMLQLFYYATKIVKVNRPLYHYRLNDTSITGMKSVESCIRKCLQVQGNVTLVETFLGREGVNDEYKLDLMYLKFVAKSQLTPIISQKKYLNEWRKLYSEINIPFLFSRFNIKLKALFFMRLLGFSRQTYGR